MRYVEHLIISQAVVLHLFCNEKRGGLWMVRYALCQGGRRLIFTSDKFCVCGQEFMLYCFTDMICVSTAVVGDNGRPLSGCPRDLWRFICRN